MLLVSIPTFVLGLKLYFIQPSCLFWLMIIQLVFSLVKEGLGKEIHSPSLLFCHAEDALSRGISNLVSSGQLKPMTGPRYCPSGTHVLYANDIMVFCKGTKRNLCNLMALFK